MQKRVILLLSSALMIGSILHNAPYAEANTITLYPVADTHISSGSPTTNYGTTTTIITSDYSSTNIRRTIIKFDLTPYTELSVTSAELILTAALDRAVDKEIKLTTSDWTETDLTWNNQPETGTIIGVFNHLDSRVVINQPYAIPLSASQIQLYAGTMLSLVIDNTGSANTFEVYSKDNPTMRPALVLTTASAPPATSSDSDADGDTDFIDYLFLTRLWNSTSSIFNLNRLMVSFGFTTTNPTPTLTPTITPSRTPTPGTTSPTNTPAPPPPTSGIWISSSEIAALPSSGTAWNNLITWANKTPNDMDNDGVRYDLDDQDSDGNVITLARALSYARTGNSSHRDGVIDATRVIVNSGNYNGRALALGRELGAYVIAADIINLQALDPALDSLFRSKLTYLRSVITTEAGSLIQCHENRPNNWGTMCGGSRAAVSAYLNDTTDLVRIAQVFKGWLGDRSSYSGFSYGELTWQANTSLPVGINGLDTTKRFSDGVTRSVDGIIPDDMRRCSGCSGSYPIYPLPYEDYVYGALNGATMQAEILYRLGHPVYEWQNQALLRTFEWLHSPVWENNTDFRADGRGNTANDKNPVWIINKNYGTSFYHESGIAASEIMGFSDWTHQ
jgi:hypothetical protein